MMMTPNTLFSQAVHLLCETGTDPALPYSERLYQAAGAAMGFGLQLADSTPAELDELLLGSRPADGSLTAAVHSFAAAPIQQELRTAAEATGIPLLALAAGLLPHYFSLAHTDVSTRDPDDRMEMVTAYCLRFTLTLARYYPDLARSYRELVPTPHPASLSAGPRGRRQRKRV